MAKKLPKELQARVENVKNLMTAASMIRIEVNCSLCFKLFWSPQFPREFVCQECQLKAPTFKVKVSKRASTGTKKSAKKLESFINDRAKLPVSMDCPECQRRCWYVPCWFCGYGAKEVDWDPCTLGFGIGDLRNPVDFPFKEKKK